MDRQILLKIKAKVNVKIAFNRDDHYFLNKYSSYNHIKQLIEQHHFSFDAENHESSVYFESAMSFSIFYITFNLVVNRKKGNPCCPFSTVLYIPP